MHKLVILSLTTLIFISLSGISQIPFPENGIIFNDELVPRVDIFINPDSLDQILASGNEESFHEYPADFVFTVNNISDTVTNVGFRLRGNTSRFSAKKSFKVSFNTFENKDFHGLEKLNINGEHNDPSIIRSKICWDICYDFGVVASRSNHVELYINNEYKGLYINVEHIDEEFINLRYGNKDGNLYKCLWPADMNYIGSDPNLYKDDTWGRRMYDLKTNTITDDYSDLANLIDVLNNTAINNLPAELESIFDVYGYLKYLVVEIFTGHWDGYSYNKNNFYLYNNPETGLFEFIPYDMDNTIGIDWIGRDWGSRDINDWVKHGEPRPLTTLILEVPEYSARFNFLFNKLMQEVVNQNIIFSKIGDRKIMIEGYVLSDIYHTIDYGWDYQSFQNSYLNPMGGHVAYGIIPYFSQRYSSAYSQLVLTNISPMISQVNSNKPGPNQLVNILCTVEDEDLLPEVILYYNLNGMPWDSIIMYDDGQHLDSESTDNIFGSQVGPMGESGEFSYYIKAFDNNGNISRYPFSGVLSLTIYETSGISLTINEFMASNDLVLSDEYNDYDDWIELLNIGSTSIYIGDKFLTDNYDTPVKWQLPDEYLDPGDYIIIWADGDENQGIHHSNFKLSASGEEIAIFDSDGLSLIDHITFGPQTTDISFGRLPNGIGPIQLLQQPTPGYSNELQSIVPLEIFSDELNIFPNPFTISCLIDLPFNTGSSSIVEIFNVYGEKIFSEEITNSQFQWDARGFGSELLSPGIYIIRVLDYNDVGTIYTGKVIYSGN